MPKTRSTKDDQNSEFLNHDDPSSFYSAEMRDGISAFLGRNISFAAEVATHDPRTGFNFHGKSTPTIFDLGEGGRTCY